VGILALSPVLADNDLAPVIVGVSAAVWLLTGFVLRTRVPAPLVVLLLAAAGVGLGWGGMQFRPDPATWEVALAIGTLAILVPAHVRIVLGRFGPR
jgi:hypothetical protein